MLSQWKERENLLDCFFELRAAHMHTHIQTLIRVKEKPIKWMFVFQHNEIYIIIAQGKISKIKLFFFFLPNYNFFFHYLLNALE